MPAIDRSWTLFLDRDGVINKKIENDYVKKWSEFEFLPGVLDAIKYFSQLFGRIVVVTNQQGIGKGLYTHDELKAIHFKMVEEIHRQGGKIDRVYYAPALSSENSILRKPNTGMAKQALEDFPEIVFNKSVMVGDSLSDMEFGKALGMKTFYISPNVHENTSPQLCDYVVSSLTDLNAHPFITL